MKIRQDRWYHVVMGWALVILGACEFFYAVLGMVNG